MSDVAQVIGVCDVEFTGVYCSIIPDFSHGVRTYLTFVDKTETFSLRVYLLLNYCANFPLFFPDLAAHCAAWVEVVSKIFNPQIQGEMAEQCDAHEQVSMLFPFFHYFNF